jgi:signal transduction histidine kinase
MSNNSLESRISKKASLYVFIFGLVLGVCQLALLYESQRNQFDKDLKIWVQSFPDSILPHLIDSDDFSVQSKVSLLQSTDLFTDFYVFRPQGETITGFGVVSPSDQNKQEIRDEAGVLWGQFSYTPNFNKVTSQIELYGAMALVVVVLLTLAIFLTIKRALRVEFKQFDSFIQRLLGVVGIVRHKSGREDGLDDLEDLQSGDKESSDQSMIRSAINSFIEELRQYDRRVAASRQLLIASEIKSARSDAIAKTAQMMAHDIRRPFQILESGLMVIGAGALDTEQVERLHADIRRSKDDVEGLLNNLIEVDREVVPDYELCSPKVLIEECLRDLDLTDKELQESTDIAFAHKHLINVDFLSIKRVFANLIDNARQASSMGGKVSIHTSEVGNRFLLTVHNFGKWISEEQLPHVFEAFFTQGKPDGSGLGLAVVKKIVEAHGGSVHCSSSEKDGTTFEVSLATTDRTEENNDSRKSKKEHPSYNPDHIQSVQNPSLVFVEDNFYIRNEFLGSCSMVPNIGFTSPREYWDWAEQHPASAAAIKVVITDLHFGLSSDQDGIKFAQVLSQKYPEVNIYLCTSSELTSPLDQCFSGKIRKDSKAFSEQVKALFGLT